MANDTTSIHTTSKTTQPGDTLVLANLKLWSGQQILDADCIALAGSQIVAIGGPADMPASAATRDCAGAWALPGLIDAHVHLELNPDDQGAPDSKTPDQRPLMVERAEKMLLGGITTARDLGGGAWHELSLRDRIASGELAGPRLLCSGQPITSPQGHCHFWGGEAANLEQAKQVMDRQIDKGVDLIKVMATGGRITKGSQPLKAQFDQQTLSAIVALAKNQGFSVAAHCHGTQGIEVAARAGVSTIEHCSWVGEEGWASDYQEPIAKLILDQGIWVSPTVNRGWQRMLNSKTGAVLHRVRAAYRAMLDMGIEMVASTDAGIPGVYHQDLAHALVVFQQIAELTNEQTLASATSDAARALGIAATTGRLEPGFTADLLLVDGNPLADLRAITQPVGVWARGRAAPLTASAA
jgi:imidazolonepropionase-like amidohydrolase